jgi:hypothetical protein
VRSSTISAPRSFSSYCTAFSPIRFSTRIRSTFCTAKRNLFHLFLKYVPFHFCFVSSQELRFIFPALPLLTMGAGVGLDALLPRDSAALLYPLSLLDPEAAGALSGVNRNGGSSKKGEIRRQQLALPLYRMYRRLIR